MQDKWLSESSECFHFSVYLAHDILSLDDHHAYTMIKEMEDSGPGEEKCLVLTGLKPLVTKLMLWHMVIPQCLEVLAGESLKYASLSPSIRVRLYLNK